MKIKTSKLIGSALDWAVAKIVQEWSDEDRWYNTIGYIDSGDPDDEPYQPSQNWSQGGKIIEETNISINYDASGRWSDGWRAFSVSTPCELGPTPLVAAMRCLVSSVFGDEVDIPESLEAYEVTLKMEDGNDFSWKRHADDSKHAEGLAIAEANSKTGEQVHHVVSLNAA